MKARDIIKTILEKKKLTQTSYTAMLKMSQSGLSGILNRDMKVSTLVKLLDVLDYDLIIKERNGDTEYIVEGESD